MNPFANGNPTIIRSISTVNGGVTKSDAMYQNNAPDNNYYDAQKISDSYMQLKQRKPMVFEYAKAPGQWVSVTMYINPNKLSISKQKVIGKTYTRGGIFYHHWGDDHTVLALSGTTGLSGMKGIEVLEEIYHASGTLLRYTTFGPERYGSLPTSQNTTINITSPTAVMTKALSMSGNNLASFQQQVQTYNAKNAAWNQYLKNIETLEYANSHDTNIAAYNSTINSLIKQYGFPDGSGNDTIPLTQLQDQKNQYSSLWDAYISLCSQLKANPTNFNLNSQIDIFKSQYKFTDLSQYFSQSTANFTASCTNAKSAWLDQFDAFVRAKNNLTTAMSSYQQTPTSPTVNLNQLIAQNQAYKNQYAFPTGSYSSLCMQNVTGQNVASNLSSVSEYFLNSYTAANATQNDINSLNAINTQLDNYVATFTAKNAQPSMGDFTAQAFKIYKQNLPNFDNSVITALVQQQALYRSGQIKNVPDQNGSSTNTGFPSTSPILYESDLAAKLSDILSAQTTAIRNVMSNVAAYEQSEKSYYQQLQNNAFADYQDDMNDVWLPRRVIVYYENRAYYGHFDSFSYNRDASNELYITYDLRLTIEQEIIGGQAPI